MNKQIECPLCRNNSSSELITDKVRFGKSADVYKCRNCSLTFIDQESFAFPKDFYEKEYHQTYITHIEPDAFDPKAYYEKMKKSNKVWADKFCQMLTGEEVVLDIGCSTGHFIDMVKDKTKKIYGHELNFKEIDFCRNSLNLDVSNQPLQDRFEKGAFDYITMIYVLEHIAEPRGFLNSLKPLLKPKGKFVILVPNAEDALVNLYDIPEFRSFYYCIEHLYYYNAETIKRLFDETGLTGKIEVLQEYPIANHLNWAYRRKPSDTLASRKGAVDVALRETSPVKAWQRLWEQLDQMYKAFLRDNGYGDRIWCVVGKN